MRTHARTQSIASVFRNALLGAGGPSVSLNVASGLGDSVFNSGSASSRRYCGNLTTAAGAVLPPSAVAPEQGREGQWVPLIEAGVFFSTGDAGLDAEDIRTIQQVATAIRAHDAVSTGDAFRVALVGRASNRWRGETGESSPQALNEGLATDRAIAVEDALTVELADIEAEVTEGVFSESKMLSLVGRARGTAPDDNGQVDRSVQIAVLYNPCGVEGQVTP
ncbi:MAG: hypothetical protein R3F61_33990 [Myxococcota bacterium]